VAVAVAVAVTADHSSPPHAQIACHPNSLAFIWIPCVLVEKYVIHLGSARLGSAPTPTPPLTPSLLPRQDPFATLRLARLETAKREEKQDTYYSTATPCVLRSETLADSDPSPGWLRSVGFARFPIEGGRVWVGLGLGLVDVAAIPERSRMSRSQGIIDPDIEGKRMRARTMETSRDETRRSALRWCVVDYTCCPFPCPPLTPQRVSEMTLTRGPPRDVALSPCPHRSAASSSALPCPRPHNRPRHPRPLRPPRSRSLTPP
jgi:hypothetical protein